MSCLRPDPVEREILSLRRAGFSYGDIARKLKLSRNQVAGIIYRAGATRDRAKSQCRSLDAAFKNQVAKAEGSAVEVGKRWGVASSSVYEWRRGLGVRRDTPFP